MRQTTVDEIVNGDVSLWWQQVGQRERFEPLSGRVECDVCIVGGGLTGLWTAYYLAKADPGLRIVVLEAEFAGFGASGRNGGWLSSELAGSRAKYARGPGGMQAVEQLELELSRSVDEVIDVCAHEGIDANIVKSGVLIAARSRAQLARMRAGLSGDGPTTELSALAFVERVSVHDVRGGTFNPQCARVQPARLVDGITSAVLRLGVTIYEDSRVLAIRPNVAVTSSGRVEARHVLRCLEGYTARLRGHRRTWLPMNSAMVVTEPLASTHWDDIGWQGRELLGDHANAYFYAQRTPDDRIAIGGRGVPYRYGSRVDTNGQTQRRTIDALRSTLDSVFPSLRHKRITHAWCGVLGVPRDWCASVCLDERTGLGWAGGYVGSGLTATNLAARTMRDLVLGDHTPLTSLPWTNRPATPWEPEPFRWLGVNSMYALFREADRREFSSDGPPSKLSTIARRLSGRH